jgi:hypothetical protein
MSEDKNQLIKINGREDESTQHSKDRKILKKIRGLNATQEDDG